VGALPGRRLLSERLGASGIPEVSPTEPMVPPVRPPASPFDVDPLRGERGRVVVVHAREATSLVLGSTQREAVVDAQAAKDAHVAVVRRRSGGGAVLIGPDDPIWIDLWIPRADPLFDDDVGRSAHWVGEWWASALARLTPGSANPFLVHRGAAVNDAWSGLVCFAGLGPGEVVAAGPSPCEVPKKLVGVAQWRGREGALFHSAAYRQFKSAPLVSLLALSATERGRLATALSARSTDLVSQLGDVGADARGVVATLLGALPEPSSWALRHSL